MKKYILALSKYLKPCTGMQCIKTLVLEDRCSIKHALWPFSDYGFNFASKLGNLGLNAANFSQFFLYFKNINTIVNL